MARVKLSSYSANNVSFFVELCVSASRRGFGGRGAVSFPDGADGNASGGAYLIDGVALVPRWRAGVVRVSLRGVDERPIARCSVAVWLAAVRFIGGG